LQKTFDLPDGSAVILSIAKYASPSGKQFEDDAVTPGTLVASNKDDLLGGDDDGGPQVEGKSAATVPAKKAAAPPDDQLTKALDLLKGKTA
jgi:carboxyl-terminal processing protease